MRNRRRAAPGDLPHLNEIRSRIRDREDLLAEARRRDGVRGASAAGGLEEEELAGDGAGVGVEREGGHVAWDGGGAGAGRGDEVFWGEDGGGGGGFGEEGFAGPVGGAVGEGCCGQLVTFDT